MCKGRADCVGEGMRNGVTYRKFVFVNDTWDDNRMYSYYQQSEIVNGQTFAGTVFDELPPHTRDFSRELGGISLKPQ